MNISLRRGEKIYMNGAIFRVDRKVCIELLNDATFLLENHVMQLADATTPLKQLYFVVQMMLISPNDISAAMELSSNMMAGISKATDDRRIAEGLAQIDKSLGERRFFEALKTARSLFPIEAEILQPPASGSVELVA